MTHLDVYRCDRKRCKEEKPAVYEVSTTGAGTYGPRPPDGWFSMLASRDGLGQGFNFCSLDCLSIWARAERLVRRVT